MKKCRVIMGNLGCGPCVDRNSFCECEEKRREIRCLSRKISVREAPFIEDFCADEYFELPIDHSFDGELLLKNRKKQTVNRPLINAVRSLRLEIEKEEVCECESVKDPTQSDSSVYTLILSLDNSLNSSRFI